MTNINDNALIVDYHDACVYSSDLSLLDSPTQWLNDACINYQMTRLQQRQQQQQQQCFRSNSMCSKECTDMNKDMDADADRDTDTNVNAGEAHVHLPVVRLPPKRIHFLDPSVVSYFMHSLDVRDEDDHSEFRGIFHNWGLPSSSKKDDESKSSPNSKQEQRKRPCKHPTVLLIPINDNNGDRQMICGGGNHWSLLVVFVFFSKRGGENKPHVWYFHFDSSSGYNSAAAMAVGQRLNKILEIGFKYEYEHGNNDHNHEPRPQLLTSRVVECKSPQQRNGYDCGVHAIVTAEALSAELQQSSDADMNMGRRGEDFSLLDQQINAMQNYLETAVFDYVSKFDSTCAMAVSKRREIARDIRQMAIAHKRSS